MHLRRQRRTKTSQRQPQAYRRPRSISPRPINSIAEAAVPNPQPHERKRSFIARYVKSKEAQKSFPDIKQRLAVAYSEARRAKLK